MRLLPIKLAFLALFIGSLNLGALAQERGNENTTIKDDVNRIVEKHLAAGMREYAAIGAAALVMNAKTGEVIASVSLHPDSGVSYNRVTKGIYEFPSVMQLSTLAMALQTKRISVDSYFDVSRPLRIKKFKFDGQKTILTLSEILTFQSKTALGRIAMKVGPSYQKLFVRSLGLNDENGELTKPIFSKNTSPLNTVANGYGAGIAFTPLHAASAIATLTSEDGRVVNPVFDKSKISKGFSIIDPAVSRSLRSLLRLNSEKSITLDLATPQSVGLASSTNKVINGKYNSDHVITTMIAILPYDHPKYVFLTLLDDPKIIDGGRRYPAGSFSSGDITAKILKDVAADLMMERN